MLSATILANLAATLTSSQDHGTPSFPAVINTSFTLTNGIGANQAQYLFADQRTLAAGANEEIDLAGGLTDAFGNAITFAAIKAILIKPASANGSTLSVGGSATNGFNDWVGAAGDLVKVRAGGLLLLVAPDATGYAVTASTGDLLKITNDDGAASATYDIVIIGE